MNENKRIRVVLDTNVVFEGLTKQGGITGAIIQAWYNVLLGGVLQMLKPTNTILQALMEIFRPSDPKFMHEFLANREVEEPQDQETASLIEKVEQRIASMTAG